MALPSGYKQVEYLESTGTQKIDCGILTYNGDSFETKIQLTNLKQNGYSIYSYLKVINYYGTMALITYGDSAYLLQSGIYEQHKIYFNGKTNELFIDDEYKATRSSDIEEQGLYLFASALNDTSYWGSSRIYYYKVIRNDQVVVDIIPCLDNNNVPCMYDNVSGNTYYNIGTGDFLYGEPIGPSTKQRLFYTYENGNRVLRFLRSGL